jgi:hypothetical protein
VDRPRVNNGFDNSAAAHLAGHGAQEHLGVVDEQVQLFGAELALDGRTPCTYI